MQEPTPVDWTFPEDEAKWIPPITHLWWDGRTKPRRPEKTLKVSVSLRHRSWPLVAALIQGKWLETSHKKWFPTSRAPPHTEGHINEGRQKNQEPGHPALDSARGLLWLHNNIRDVFIWRRTNYNTELPVFCDKQCIMSYHYLLDEARTYATQSVC